MQDCVSSEVWLWKQERNRGAEGGLLAVFVSCLFPDAINATQFAAGLLLKQVSNTQYRACNRQAPQNINTSTLTHLNFAFVGIDPSTFELAPLFEQDIAFYTAFTALKHQKSHHHARDSSYPAHLSSSHKHFHAPRNAAALPPLQTWFSVGGGAFNVSLWSEMSRSEQNRRSFIQSCVQWLQDAGWDGVDIDWEFPSPSDTANLVLLAQELRGAFDEVYAASTQQDRKRWGISFAL